MTTTEEKIQIRTYQIPKDLSNVPLVDYEAIHKAFEEVNLTLSEIIDSWDKSFRLVSIKVVPLNIPDRMSNPDSDRIFFRIHVSRQLIE